MPLREALSHCRGLRTHQPVESPWHGLVCPVVREGRCREAPPIPINHVRISRPASLPQSRCPQCPKFALACPGGAHGIGSGGGCVQPAKNWRMEPCNGSGEPHIDGNGDDKLSNQIGADTSV